jgi:Kef-type K+ transport system membrane component KefB
LVVVTLALQAGAINSQLFTILVLIALITTAMTAPALRLLKIRPDSGARPTASQPDFSAAGSKP